VRSLTVMMLLSLTMVLPGAEALTQPPYPKVRVDTNVGSFELELDGPRAPLTVNNFMRYVREGGYEGSIFHRVIPGFMAQAGGLDGDFQEMDHFGPIPNESGNGLSNERGTIAMARSGDPHSATRQFFINLVDNTRLDPRPGGWGYAVFGRVTEGMEVVDRIAAIPTGPGGPFPTDVPQSPVVIEKMTVLDESEDG
jgi:peptidyl-prolyl cis-trans isomerase B (cyclophilin B)